MARQMRSLLYPVIIGLATLALIYVFFSMVGMISAKEAAMLNRLVELHDTSFEQYQYRSGWDLFLLNVFISSVILFAAGFISATFARPAKASLVGWLKAPLLAGVVPALALDVYLLITWYNSVQLYNSGGTLDGRPFEPMIPPVALLFVGMITIFCLGFSMAGGVLAWAELKRDSG